MFYPTNIAFSISFCNYLILSIIYPLENIYADSFSTQDLFWSENNSALPC